MTVCDGDPHWSQAHPSQDSISAPRRASFLAGALILSLPDAGADVSVVRPVRVPANTHPFLNLPTSGVGLHCASGGSMATAMYQDSRENIATVFVGAGEGVGETR